MQVQRPGSTFIDSYWIKLPKEWFLTTDERDWKLKGQMMQESWERTEDIYWFQNSNEIKGNKPYSTIHIQPHRWYT